MNYILSTQNYYCNKYWCAISYQWWCRFSILIWLRHSFG